MKRILVIGGSGFVGTNLLIKLSNQKKYKLTGTYFKKKNFHKVKNVKYLKLNVNNINHCIKVCKNKDIVFMCAANTSGALQMQNNPLQHFSPNIKLNLNVLESSYLAGVKKFFFFSSNTVYPVTNKKVTENDVNGNFFSKYHIVASMKYFIEKACYIFSKKVKNPMTTIVLRPGNLYGPYDKFDSKKSKVIPSLIRKILSKNRTLEVWGDGKDIKDFLYIEDMCDFIVKNLNKFKEFDIVNVCSSKQITINQIIKILFNIIGGKKNIIYDTGMPSMIPKRIMSNKKAITHYNLNVRISMRVGLEKTLNWYKNS